MQMNLEWPIFKSVCTARSLSMQYIDLTGSYALMAFDQAFEICCNLVETADITDFETNYKTTGNKPLTNLTAAFSAKTFGSKRLFARNTGMQFSLSAGSNVLTYTATYAWTKIIGMELINAEALDTCELKVLDSTAGTYSGIPNYLLNQFGYTLNMGPNFYIRTSPFDADLYVGMQLQFTYVSVSAKTVGLNIIQNEVKT